jgi:hypothetical protein
MALPPTGRAIRGFAMQWPMCQVSIIAMPTS